MRRIYITGSAGFVGFHLARHLLDEGMRVHGFDAVTPYYDRTLKRDRTAILEAAPRFSWTEAALEDDTALTADMARFAPEIVIHLAAQAGVRHSIEAPRGFISSNVTGSFNVLEAARAQGVSHLLLASTSSVYGANTAMPYAETDKTDTQVSLYAATKKAAEAMAHAYAHLHALPVTVFRFFTVYGPWGRPDMAPWLFTRAVLAGEPIRVYGHGRMFRDFTHVSDLVSGIRGLIDVPPPLAGEDVRGRMPLLSGDSLSQVAPWRIVNVGNGRREALNALIEAIEMATGRQAIRDHMQMQKGDMVATWADNALLRQLTGYNPRIGLVEGIGDFVRWYRDYHRI